jgi:hypothetical protein
MQKKVLSEVDLYFGEIASPKGFEINRDRIKGDILTSFINQKRINNNPQAYAYKDYQVPFSQPLTWLKDYLRDHIKVEYGFTWCKNLNMEMFFILENNLLQDI